MAAPSDGVVDAHTHLLPDRLATAVRGFFAAHGMDRRLAYPTDPRTVLDDLAGQGVRGIWNLPYAHKPGIAEGLNAAMADVALSVADHPVRVVTGCTAHPGDGDPGAVVRQAVEAHGAGVVKLHCSVGGYGPDHPGLTGVYDVAGDLGLPVVVHVGHSPSGRTAVDDLAGLGAVADAHPGTTIVIAHTAHPATARAIDLLRAHPNLMADLTPVIDDLVDLGAADVADLADRLLLGTDAPNTARRVTELLAWLDGLDLPADAVSAITRENAERLVP